MFSDNFSIKMPANEPILDYKPGSVDRIALEKELAQQSKNTLEIPLSISGKEIKTGKIIENYAPHDNSLLLAKCHIATENEIELAVGAVKKAWKIWSEMPWQQRAAVFMRAADLLAGKYRYKVDAAVMLGQSKNIYQAEIDVCELIDFWRFNVAYLERIYANQPNSTYGTWNRSEYRPLEGFVLGITPFNFIAIGANLPTAPAICGNVAIWKPASSTIYSNHMIMDILKEAGMPEDVIVFLPSSGRMVGETLLKHPDLSGVHFTGSTAVFQNIWRTVGQNIESYKTYPRIVGETGGKDFVVVHKSADVRQTVVALARGAYEYQGQKCSAASRTYIPKSLWPAIKQDLEKEVQAFSQGDPAQGNFFNAVIDEPAFDNIKGFIDYAKESSDAEIHFGGECDKSKGFFVEPTLIEAKDPHFKTMEEEIFGPVLTAYVYDDDKYEEILSLCDNTSGYALTGGVFANERIAVELAERKLRHSAGNFYINDKPTGAVVGQQPFGGSRLSGTNDKAGSFLNMLRWVSARSIKENTIPPTTIGYPFMG